MITMYGIPNCDKIKKAKVWLEKHNAEYTFYNYKTEGCDENLANKLLSHFSYKDVLNKRGTTWRKLPENKKSTVDEIAAIELDYGTNDAIEEFGVTFAYKYFESNTTT